MIKVNLNEMLARFTDHWNPRIVGELNGQQVKLAKVCGEFDWHHHEHEDELFYVIEGELEIRWKNNVGDVESTMISPGEFFIVPRGVEHQPLAKSETAIMLFEPASTLNTGNVESEKTREQLEKLI